MSRFLRNNLLFSALSSAAVLAAALPLAHAAFPRGGVAPAGAVFPISYYNTFSGWTFPSNKFPIGQFGEDPTGTGTNSGANLAVAGVALGMPIFFGSPAPTGIATDGGQFTAAKNAGAYLFIQSTNSGSNTTANQSCAAFSGFLNNICTVNNIIAAATFYGALGNLLGYDLGDEPTSGSNGYNPPAGFTQPQQGAVATAVSNVLSYDGTRLNFIGQGSCIPYGGATLLGCDANAPVAFAAPSLPAYDDYPTLSNFNGPWLIQGSHVQLSDAAGLGAASHGNDADWLIAVGQLNTLSNNAAQGVNKPTIHINASGADALGYSSGGSLGNEFWIHTTSGSTAITIGASSSGYAFFSDALMVHPSGGSKLSVATDTGVSTNCLGASSHINSVTDSTHANLDVNAVTTGDCFVRLTGGTINITGALPNGSACNQILGLCAPYNNSYRDAPEATASQEMMAVIHGALLISEFCHDVASVSFCDGDPAAAGTGNPAIAAAAATNMAYIHGVFNTYAAVLQQPATAVCSMQKQDFTSTSSCTNGVMTMTTGTAACPGAALLLPDPSNSAVHWLVTMSMRKSWSATNCGATSGATFTWALTGYGSQVATIMADKASQFDPAHNTVGNTINLSGGSFSDTLGANGLSYHYKVYKIQ